MLREALDFLLDVLLQPFAVILLLRFHLQWMRAPMRNPFGEFIMGLTNFIVLPTRRYIPSFRGYDSSTLLLAYIFETLYLYLSEFVWIYSSPDGNYLFLGLLTVTMVRLLSLSISLLMFATIIQAVLSWVNPHTALSPMLSTITFPFIKPLQNRIPPVGNVDLSAFVLIILCQLTLMIPIYYLDKLMRSFI